MEKKKHTCAHCSSEWVSAISMTVCPFCGQALTPEKKKFTQINEVLAYLFDSYGVNVINERRKFLSLLADYAPDMEMERRLIKIAVDADVYQNLLNANSMAENERKTCANKMAVRLQQQYFISTDWSQKAVIWFVEYLDWGVAFGQAEKTEEKTAPVSQTPSPPQSEPYRMRSPAKEVIRPAEPKAVKVEKPAYQPPVKKPEFRITEAKTFASDGTVDGRKLYSTSFFNQEISYLGLQLYYQNAFVGQKINLTWRIYREKGVAFSGELKTSYTLNNQNGSFFHQWGWDKAGHWPVGKYKIEASIDGISGKHLAYFEIKKGKFDQLATPVLKHKLFTAGSVPPPLEQRKYANVFSKATVAYVYFQVEYQRPWRNLLTTFDYKIIGPNGNVVANITVPVEIKSDYVVSWVGYGWEDPGHWSPGTYTYTVSLGRSSPVSGAFTIKP